MTDSETWDCWSCGENVKRFTLHICPPQQTSSLPQTSNERKEIPLFEGVLQYFPAALAEVAKVSKFGNDKHNGKDTPLQHTRGKSMDHADCILRHLVDMADNDGYDPESGLPQAAYVAWRALALCQEWLEKKHGVPLAPNAKEE